MVYIKNDKYIINGKEIYLNGIIKQKLDSIKKLIEDKWDFCFLIDGNERSGKTTLGITYGWYLSNGKLSIDNLCKSSETALEKIKRFGKGDVLIVDESSLVFNSSDSITKELRKLSKIMDICGFKGIIFILICPAFYKLKWDLAVRRSKFLIHVYTQKNWKRGYFAYFGDKKKKTLFNYAIKHYGSYKNPNAAFNGTFPEFKPFGEECDNLKEETLDEQMNEKGKMISTERFDKLEKKFEFSLFLLNNIFIQRIIIDKFKEGGYEMSKGQISEAISQAKRRHPNFSFPQSS